MIAYMPHRDSKHYLVRWADQWWRVPAVKGGWTRRKRDSGKALDVGASTQLVGVCLKVARLACGIPGGE